MVFLLIRDQMVVSVYVRFLTMKYFYELAGEFSGTANAVQYLYVGT
jgi:hypothetical protein